MRPGVIAEGGGGRATAKEINQPHSKDCKIYCVSIAALQNVVLALTIIDNNKQFHQARGLAANTTATAAGA